MHTSAMPDRVAAQTQQTADVWRRLEMHAHEAVEVRKERGGRHIHPGPLREDFSTHASRDPKARIARRRTGIERARPHAFVSRRALGRTCRPASMG